MLIPLELQETSAAFWFVHFHPVGSCVSVCLTFSFKTSLRLHAKHSSSSNRLSEPLHRRQPLHLCFLSDPPPPSDWPLHTGSRSETWLVAGDDWWTDEWWGEHTRSVWSLLAAERWCHQSAQGVKTSHYRIPSDSVKSRIINQYRVIGDLINRSPCDDVMGCLSSFIFATLNVKVMGAHERFSDVLFPVWSSRTPPTAERLTPPTSSGVLEGFHTGTKRVLDGFHLCVVPQFLITDASFFSSINATRRRLVCI